jgi:hypothetical protein
MMRTGSKFGELVGRPQDSAPRAVASACGTMLAMLLASLIQSQVQALTPTPTVTPCNGAPVTPTASPVPLYDGQGVQIVATTTPAASVITQSYLEAKWLSVGDQNPLNPQKDVSPRLAAPSGISPSYDAEPLLLNQVWSTDPALYDRMGASDRLRLTQLQDGNYPNNHGALHSEAVYTDAVGSVLGPGTLPTLLGAYMGAILDVSPGLNETRKSDTKREDGIEKSVIGAFNQALVRRGGSANYPGEGDLFTGTNCVNTTVALANIGLPTDAMSERPLFVDLAVASQYEAMVGSTIDGDIRSRKARPSASELAPTNVSNMIGASGSVAMDGAVFDRSLSFVSINEGFMTIGIFGSLVNSAIVRFGLFSLDLSDDLGSSDPSAALDHATGSRIGHWIGLLVRTPSIGPNAGIRRAAGMDLHDQALYATGKRPLRNAIVSSPLGAPFDNPSIHSDGPLVIGDGHAFPEVTGYDTDVLHVRDFVQLRPVRGKGAWAEELLSPPGTIFFDLDGADELSEGYPGLCVRNRRVANNPSSAISGIGAPQVSLVMSRLVFDETSVSTDDIRYGNNRPVQPGDPYDGGISQAQLLLNIKLSKRLLWATAPHVTLRLKTVNGRKLGRIVATGFSDPKLTVERARLGPSADQGVTRKSEVTGSVKHIKMSATSDDSSTSGYTFDFSSSATTALRGPSEPATTQEEFLLTVSEDESTTKAIKLIVPSDAIFPVDEVSDEE